jgi:hypothetical protein
LRPDILTATYVKLTGILLEIKTAKFEIGLKGIFIFAGEKQINMKITRTKGTVIHKRVANIPTLRKVINELTTIKEK